MTASTDPVPTAGLATPVAARSSTPQVSVRTAGKVLVGLVIIVAATIGSPGGVDMPWFGIGLAVLVLDVRNPVTMRNIVVVYVALLFGWGADLYAADPARVQGTMLWVMAAFLVGYAAASLARHPRTVHPPVSGAFGRMLSAGRDVKSAVVTVTALYAGATLVTIVSAGIHAYYSGQVQASLISAYGASGGQVAPTQAVQTVLGQVLTATVIAYGAQCVAQDRRISYRWVVGPLVLLPMAALERSQAFLGVITLLGIYTVDRRARDRAPRRSAKQVLRVTRRSGYVWLTVFVGVVIVFVVLAGEQRQAAIDSSTGVASNAGISSYLEEELTPVQAFSEIQSQIGYLGQQHGRTVLVPLVLRYLPRSLDPSKQLNSNAYYMTSLHSDEYQAGFAMPVTVFGDGYLNFGFSGLLLVSLLLGAVAQYCDSFYRDFDRHRAIIYLLGISNVYFVMRDCLANTGAQVALSILVVLLLGVLFAGTREGVGREARVRPMVKGSYPDGMIVPRPLPWAEPADRAVRRSTPPIHAFDRADPSEEPLGLVSDPLVLPSVGPIAGLGSTDLPTGGAPRRWKGGQWNVLDQGVSSLTTLVLAVAAAHLTTTGAFDEVAIAVIVYAFASGGVRCLLSDPFLIAVSRGSARGNAARRVLNDAFWCGGILGVALLVAAAVAGGGWLVVLAVLGLSLPIVLLQDAARYLLFSEHRYGLATASDAVWLVVQLAGVVILVLDPSARSAGAVLVTWVVGGAAACGVALGCVRLWPAARPDFSWAREASGIGVPLLGEFISVSGATQIALVGLVAVIGTASVASWRAANLLVGPMTVLVVAVTVFLERRGLTVDRRTGRRRVRPVVESGVALTVTAVVLLVFWLNVPAVGRLALGKQWADARALLVVATLFVIGGLWAMLASIAMRLLGLQRRSFVVRTVLAPVYFVVPSLVGWRLGSVPSLTSLAGAAIFDGLVLWWALCRGRRKALEEGSMPKLELTGR